MEYTLATVLVTLGVSTLALGADGGVTTKRHPPAKGTAVPLTIAFGGDVTLGYHYEEYFDEQVGKGRPREELLAHGFAKIRSAAEEADLFVVNLECPFTRRGEKIPKNFNFRARPELVGALLAGGVDVVSLANNHLMDYGVEGLLDTQAELDQVKVVHFGAGANLAAARRAAVVERKGVRVGFLGYFFLGDRNIEPPQVIATERTPGVAGHYSDTAELERMVREDVALTRRQADLVIPFFHWGREGSRTPEPYQVRLAHVAIDAGAAAVIGSHPHVLQGIELYKGAPVIYSLGNLVFGGNWDPRDKQSALVFLRFSAAGLLSARLLPLHTDKYPEVPIQPHPVTGEQAEAVLDRLAESSRAFAQTLPELSARKPRADAATPDAGR